MKGIVLAGGAGTRLYPLTKVTSKQLLPVYDKPMVYYALSTLMLAGIRDILLISTPEDLPNFKNLLGNGSQFGLTLTFLEQPAPNGLAQAFLIGEDFLGDDTCALILGDNIFYGSGFIEKLQTAVRNAQNGYTTVFGSYVSNPERFGVMELDENNQIISVEEKPQHPKSNYCITGLYFYDNRVLDFAKQIRHSARGELEITDINELYLRQNALKCILLGRGFTWLDAGTVESLFIASDFVRMIETRQGIQIGAPEEIAYQSKWISKQQLLEAAAMYGNSPYGQHLKKVAEGSYVYGRSTDGEVVIP